MENRFILLDEDHKLLTKALETDKHFALLGDAEKSSIKNRLANAELVTTADFPNNVSRLYDVITLRKSIMQLFDCKYMCSYLTAQILF